MDREVWHGAVRGVATSQTRLSDWTELNWIFSIKVKMFELFHIFKCSDKSESEVCLLEHLYKEFTPFNFYKLILHIFS